MTLEHLSFFFLLSGAPLGGSKQHLIEVIVCVDAEADVMASHVVF
jgi:hypothetical protein